MSKIKDNFLNFINRLFNKTNLVELSSPQSEVLLKEVRKSRIIRDFERTINNGINISKIDGLYRKKLDNPKDDIYNMPLVSKISEKQTIELAKDFFLNLSPELFSKANQVMDNNSKEFIFIFEQYGKQVDMDGNSREAEVKDFREVYCPIREDLRDLYGVVHEVTHTFDLENGDTEARKIFGEIAPQCMERLLDEFLLQLSNDDMKKYGLDRDTLMQDIRNRQISTFLSRNEKIKSFNNVSGNEIKDLRYILAQVYSFEFMKLKSEKKVDILIEFMKNIKENNIEKCRQFLRIDLKDKIKMQSTIQKIVDDVKNTYNQIVLQEKLQEILKESKNDKDFVEKIGNQNIHIILESKIPFLLITPSNLNNNQILVMESNNLEVNNMQELLIQAWGTGKYLNHIFHGNNPILIPILPSPSTTGPYYQQLSAECFSNGERPDLDVVEVIAKAKDIMEKQYNLKLNDKIFLNGYSTSGCFAQRFSLIHPELIDTACIGGASGSIPIPNTDLDYPLGIRNYEELFGKKFDIDEYKKIIFDYYVGSLECETKFLDITDEDGNLAPMHDMSYFDRSIPKSVGEAQREKLGKEMFERAKKTIEILKDMGINISHTVLNYKTYNNQEAYKLMRKNSLYKNVKGIHDDQKQIICSTFDKMIKRYKDKENDNILSLNN